MGVEDMIDLFM